MFEIWSRVLFYGFSVVEFDAFTGLLDGIDGAGVGSSGLGFGTTGSTCGY